MLVHAHTMVWLKYYLKHALKSCFNLCVESNYTTVKERHWAGHAVKWKRQSKFAGFISVWNALNWYAD